MRRKYLIGMIWVAIMGMNPSIAQPPSITLNSVSPTGPVDQYDKFEINFNLNKQYTEPHNPYQINAYAEFTAPVSGKVHKVYAFLYSDFTQQNFSCTGPGNPNNIQREHLHPSNIYDWRIRFTPDEPGTWQYRIIAVETTPFPSTTSYPSSGTLNFQCSTSTNKGFIVKANDKFLKRTTGEFFFPVGMNLAWYESCNGNVQYPYGINYYKYMIDKYAADQKINFIRIWMDYYEGIALVGYDNRPFYPATQAGYFYKFNLYNQQDAYELDKIFEYAKSRDVNIMLCLFETASNANPGNFTNKNPFNFANGGSITAPEAIFTDAVAKEFQKEMLKYVISRWGHATNLVAWELWNEVNLFPDADPVAVKDWHATMYTYMKSIDPYNHLITTSYGGEPDNVVPGSSPSPPSASAFYPMDLTQMHLYKDAIGDEHCSFQSHCYSAALKATNTFQKPFMTGEWYWAGEQDGGQYDLKAKDPNGFEIHATLWSSAFSTAFGSAANWHWERVDQQNIQSLYTPVCRFMNDLPVPSASFTPHELGYRNAHANNGLRTYYMKNLKADTIYGWTQDTNFYYQSLAAQRNDPKGKQYLQSLHSSYKPDASNVANEIWIKLPLSQHNKVYIVRWYNSETGSIHSTSTSVSIFGLNNSYLVISIPQALRRSNYGDAVFAAYEDCSVNVWREGVLNGSAPQEAVDEVVYDNVNDQVFYNTVSKIHSMHWDAGSQTWYKADLNNAASNVVGYLTYSPAAKQLFYLANNHKINSIWLDANTGIWNWSPLDNAATNAAGPLAVNNTGTEVYYRTTSGGLNSIRIGPTGWTHFDLNNAATSNVSSSFALYGTQVFYRTLDEKLNSIWYDQATQRYWHSDLNNSAAWNVCGDVTVTPNGQVFYVTCDGKINNIWHSAPAGWTWDDLDNSATNVIGSLMADNAGKVFYMTTNNNINCIYWDNAQWNRSELSNATSGNFVYGTLTTDNIASVFFRASDNRVHRIYYKSQCFDVPSQSFLSKSGNEDIAAADTEEKEEERIVSKRDILVYPNPSDNKITLTSDDLISRYAIYNVQGQLIKEMNIAGSKEIEIAVGEFTDGIYFVNIYLSNGEFANRKIVIQH